MPLVVDQTLGRDADPLVNQIPAAAADVQKKLHQRHLSLRLQAQVLPVIRSALYSEHRMHRMHLCSYSSVEVTIEVIGFYLQLPQSITDLGVYR